MATHSGNQVAPRSGAPSAAAFRMGTLAAGALGLTGFSLAIICGLSAGNSIAQIIEKALVTAGCLVVVGGVAGAVAGHIIREQMVRRLAELQQEQEQHRETQAQVSAARQGAEPARSGTPGGSG